MINATTVQEQQPMSIDCDISSTGPAPAPAPAVISPTSSCESSDSQRRQPRSSRRGSGRPNNHQQKQQRREREESRNLVTSSCWTVNRSTIVTPSRSSFDKSTTNGISRYSPTQLHPPPPSSLLLSTPLPLDHHIVYLIRHGESKGQVTPKVRRLRDPALLDCGLTDLGQQQASQMVDRYNLPLMDLVLCSPLTRALETAVLAFPTTTSTETAPIVVHYELRELGRTDIPENTPRSWRQVLPDLSHHCDNRIDTQSLKPTNLAWPQHHNRTPTVLRRKYIQQIFPWLAQHYLLGKQKQQQPLRIALVCHFHVIRAALTDHKGFCDPRLRPENAKPIPCILTPQGQLLPIEEGQSF